MQSVLVEFSCTEKDDVKTISCMAQVKLPILKKTLKFSTDYQKDADPLSGWIRHVPPHEDNQSVPAIENTSELRGQKVFDAITFFMALHEGEWKSGTVSLAVGRRIVNLEVVSMAGGYELRRPEKGQMLFVRKDAKGIFALEIPIPVLGTLNVKRVN